MTITRREEIEQIVSSHSKCELKEVIKMSSNTKSSTRHPIPTPPKRQDVLKQGRKLDGPRKRGEGTRQEQILRFMSLNPSILVDHEYLQGVFELKHPQQVRQPISKLVEKDLVEIYEFKEQRGKRVVNIYRYSLTQLGVNECKRRGYKVNLSKLKESGILD